MAREQHKGNAGSHPGLSYCQDGGETAQKSVTSLSFTVLLFCLPTGRSWLKLDLQIFFHFYPHSKSWDILKASFSCFNVRKAGISSKTIICTFWLARVFWFKAFHNNSKKPFKTLFKNPGARHPFGRSEKSEPAYYRMVVPALPTQKQACTWAHSGGYVIVAFPAIWEPITWTRFNGTQGIPLVRALSFKLIYPVWSYRPELQIACTCVFWDLVGVLSAVLHSGLFQIEWKGP